MSAVLKDNDVINAIKGMDGWNYDDAEIRSIELTLEDCEEVEQ